MKELEERLEGLKEALKEKAISVNEYCSMYHQTYQQIKRLKSK